MRKAEKDMLIFLNSFENNIQLRILFHSTRAENNPNQKWAL